MRLKSDFPGSQAYAAPYTCVWGNAYYSQVYFHFHFHVLHTDIINSVSNSIKNWKDNNPVRTRVMF
jgi:hypothetical protein